MILKMFAFIIRSLKNKSALKPIDSNVDDDKIGVGIEIFSIESISFYRFKRF